MGTHPNAPSKLHENSEDLGALLKANPVLSTDECHKAYDGDLPFLFKARLSLYILSIFCALLPIPVWQVY